MSTTTSKGSLFRSLIITLGIICIGTAAYSIVEVNRQAKNDQANIQSIADLRVKALRITKLADDAVAAREEAFDSLTGLNTQMERGWKALQQRLNTQNEISRGKIKLVADSWDKVQEELNQLADSREPVIFVSTVARKLNETLPQVQDHAGQVVDALIAQAAPAGQIAIAQEQLWLIERIGRNIDKMILASGDANVAADQFKADSNIFRDTLDSMKNGNFILGITKVTNKEALASIGQIQELFDVVANDIDRIYNSANDLSTARQSAEALLADVPVLLTQLDDLDNTVADLADSEQRLFNDLTSLAAVAGFFTALVILGFINFTATRRNLIESEQIKDKNQQAILQLLDDISDLADGDLTAEATVTEDFTGTIADSINFAIGELRSLVENVASSSEKLTGSADATRATSLQLAESAEHQAQEIAGVSAAINEMAITIDQVSSNSAESAAVAERSVSIAKNGSQVVRNTIEGMDTIREQIQDTSKRIKRLGESSQEIGDIVSLINEIAEQTNILALNAAIQAAMAGEAGRGFAVVADEVQRLAERSATATKQIAGLVKTIQSDTNEAVSSMEQTTAEVVKGAELAHSAGIALEEIETVSTNLAELIQDISEAAKHQATTSGHISNTMNVIQEITSQTLSGTNDTATSIGELAEMAVEMKHSVSGFILPDSNKNLSPSTAEEVPLASEQELDDDQLGALFAVATDQESDHAKESAGSNDEQGLNLDFVASADMEQDFNEDLEVDIEDPDELLHLEEFEAEIEAMLSDGDDKKT
ncbi:methyl-accepting chemotaxis protein [SAR92 clade bacterium H455]|uniref:Methyl-accepting chemotaxis protein n=1 Tax=SAR92 clade bacterium H455 TaxID=2974818 RepID=A0ABY5TMQ6_9GAMM|nr:methyl-accepting chemotaxis protein [SAR92 clade bacterium H455]